VISWFQSFAFEWVNVRRRYVEVRDAVLEGEAEAAAAVGLTLNRIQLTHSLKPPGSNP
jgi:hypothetical protein